MIFLKKFLSANGNMRISLYIKTSTQAIIASYPSFFNACRSLSCCVFDMSHDVQMSMQIGAERRLGKRHQITVLWCLLNKNK